MAQNRFSMLSTTSHPNFPPQGGSAAPMSTSALLSTLHQAYQSGTPYNLDASTTLVVNSNQADSKLVVDEALGVKVWEHARRRAEDQSIVIGTLNAHTPSLLIPILSTFPQSTVPDILTTAISLLQCFTHALTPFSPTSEPLHHGLAVGLQFSLTGSVVSATISLTTAGINTQRGLLSIPSERGHRAFDVFYYLLSAASTPAEREFLSLQSPEKYALLARSGTYSPPSYLPTADDSAAADDFRANLRAIGIKGAALRGMLSVLAGLLKLGNGIGLLVDAEAVEEVCEEVAGLLGVEPEVLAKKLGDAEREALIDAVYEALVQWVIGKANEAVAEEFAEINRRMTEGSSSEGGDTVQVNVIELPDEKMVKALCLRNVFDDETGINSEMKYDGVEMPAVSPSVLREVKGATSDAEKEGFLGMTREKEFAKDRKEGVVEKVGREADEDSFLHNILFPNDGQSEQNKKTDIATVLASSRVWWHLSVCPTDGGSSPGTAPSIGAWSAAVVSRQIRNWRLPEWIARRSKRLDFTADFDMDEFHQRYAVLGCLEGRDGIDSWIMERGWSNGEVIVGKERVWMREGAWWEAEQMLDLKPGMMPMDMGMGYPAGQQNAGYFPPAAMLGVNDSRDQVYGHNAPGMGMSMPSPNAASPGGGEGRGLLGAQFDKEAAEQYQGALDPELSKNKQIKVQTMDGIRRTWVAITWALTFWIPSFLLSSIGRMKRPDVRMAWREKCVLVFFIFLLNGIIIFWIILFARILCPEFDKVFSLDEVSGHTGRDDFWVAIHGKAYDISKFWTLQHSDSNIKTTNDIMEPFAGLDLSDYFPMPLHLTCKGLEVREGQALESNETLTDQHALHKSGGSTDPNSALYQKDWYTNKFLKKMEGYFKGYIVYDKQKVADTGRGTNKPWGVYEDSVYDLTDYIYTADRLGGVKSAGAPNYKFLAEKFVDVFTNNPGVDITEMLNDVLGDMKKTERDAHIRCLKNQFFIGKVDTRKTARCQVNGIMLVVFAAIITAVILVKFLAALQLGSKRKPAPQDKFVICQIPAYTEGEDQLRKALDSLTALQYDNKRKLLCVICDGLVVGGGNDRPTPNIVCDILGVDPKIDPPALPFNSVGEGSNQLNYGKVYSGLYEFEGCVVPYIVVVKVGKPNETSKPGNRGKRDSQILLLNFLNRVHHRGLMSPLELEMFHQINNVIGVDPELYEYLLMVDADTSVKPDALTRLVAACANDAKIAGICGETSLENEERSWWTMIQVYEYYISHHLSKAFESLFGSVTCLPGCFSMYRLRTADKGKPLIIADAVIQEYSDGVVDTLHKKNLLSLGEDRFLTTLMTKHFPRMSYKFIPDAYAMTAAPETWSVLLSQRRRWINSTIHNLAELVLLKEMCGFCCFSMRFVVFIDLMGTIILPATCVYIGYIIYLVASGTGALPLFSIIMIAAVYGLQAIIFIVKRQWQHIGWMIIYILAYPIYSFILPIYSFWNQDNFSWGSTRIVLGESGDKQVIAVEDEGFDPKDIPLEYWDNYAMRNNLPGRRGGAGGEKAFDSMGMVGAGVMTNEYEMDDLHSVYSSVKPASTVLTGLPMMGGVGVGGAPGMGYMQPPQQHMMNRQSSYSAYSSMTGLPMQPHMQQGPLGSQPHLAPHSRLPSMQLGGAGDYWQDGPANNNNNMRSSQLLSASSDNLMAMGGQRSPRGFGGLGSRPVSQIDLTRGPGAGPDDASIVEAIRAVLREVDLDSVTKKQVRVKVEQMLQMELVGERKTFMDSKLDEILASM